MGFDPPAPPGGNERWAIGCTTSVCLFWTLSLIVPWYTYEFESVGAEGTANCWVTGQCLSEGALSNEANVSDFSEDVGEIFDATASFWFMGWFFLLTVLIGLCVKKFYYKDNLFLCVVPLLCVSYLWFLIAIILFPSGIDGTQEGGFSGSNNLDVSTALSFAPSAGWYIGWIMCCCYCPAGFFVYVDNPLNFTVVEEDPILLEAEEE